MKLRYDHWSQASMYSLGMKIWFFNPQRRKGKCPQLTSPWQSLGVILSQICDVVIEIKMRPLALPRIIHANRLQLHRGDKMPSWIALTLEAEVRLSTSVDAGSSLE